MLTNKLGWPVSMVLFGVVFASVSAAEKTLPFALQILDAEVGQIEIEAKRVSQSLTPADAKTLSELLQKQRAELVRVEAKYRSISDPTKSDLSNSLTTFFRYANEVRKIIAPAKVKALGKSDSPHDCSNHCYRSCGYNSIGELICYNKCVKCCNSGGCS